MKTDAAADSAKLRLLAEARLQAKRDSGVPSANPVELLRIKHELEVHQIELEMQNEELRQARAEAETALANYTDLYDFAPTGYCTLARDGTVLAVNLTGARLVGIERAGLIGRRVGWLFAEKGPSAFRFFLEEIFDGKRLPAFEGALEGDGKKPGIIVRVEAVLSEGGQECRASMTDVTERHQAAAERERLIETLRQSALEVKMLSGLLPICGHCKKIRNDTGYWEQIEAYISHHSQAVFSHSICPECIVIYYPDYVPPADKKE